MSIGNDLVCLSLAPNKLLDRRFIQRVFNECEQEALSQASAPHQFLWAMWAVKEATFKAYQQQNEEAFFSPKTIQVRCHDDRVSQSTPLIGQALIDDQHYYFEVVLTKHYLHALVAKTPAELSKSVVEISRIKGEPNYLNQSIRAKKLMLSLAKRQGLKADEIRRELLGEQKKRPPKLYHSGICLPVSLSLSHDGHYLAVCVKQT